MILEFRIKGYKVYSEEVGLSLRAEPPIDVLGCNVHKEGEFGVLKAACVYGPNNFGKSSLVDAIGTMVNVLKNEIKDLRILDILVNLFSDDDDFELGVSFLYDGIAYDYDFKYGAYARNEIEKGFIYERFSKLDAIGDEKGKTIFEKDVENGKYFFDGDEALSKDMADFSFDNILIYAGNSATKKEYVALEACKKILDDFARGVDVVDMARIVPDKTMTDLKNDKSMEGEIEKFVKCADLDIDRFAYIRPGVDIEETIDLDDDSLESRIRTIYSEIPDENVYRLISFHKGIPLPSVMIDSSGTMKVISLASHIIDAVRNGKTLVIDELDNGLHSRLTRAIVMLFDDELNDRGQLIFTTHDMALLDCERLFRKDQVWFVDKDKDRAYLYSVSDFDEDGKNTDGDTLTRYKHGEFGAISSPRFDSILGEEGDKRDE